MPATLGLLDLAVALVDDVALGVADIVTTTVCPGAMLVTMDGEGVKGGADWVGEDVVVAIDDVVDDEIAPGDSLPL